MTSPTFDSVRPLNGGMSSFGMDFASDQSSGLRARVNRRCPVAPGFDESSTKVLALSSVVYAVVVIERSLRVVTVRSLRSRNPGGTWSFDRSRSWPPAVVLSTSAAPSDITTRFIVRSRRVGEAAQANRASTTKPSKGARTR
jgi:hypothetical protein